MIKLSDISWNVPEEEYRADKAYSYSTLSRFHREGFTGLPRLFDKVSSPSLLFGSLVDTLMTDKEEFEKRFSVCTLPELSESLDAIVRDLATNYGAYKDINKIPDDILAQVGEEHSYYKTDKYKAYRVKKIKEECAEMYKILTSTQDKTIISEKLYSDAMACVEALHSNPETSFFFAPNNPFDDTIERYYQLKFKGEYEGIPVRCMFDLLIIDKKNKKITPVDLKTSYKNEIDFPKSFFEWNYGIQANLYTYILKQNLKDIPEFQDYTITSYYFIVVSNNSRRPMIWCTSSNHSELTVNIHGKEIPNWRILIKELHYYLSKETLPEYPIWKKPYNSIEDYVERNMKN